MSEKSLKKGENSLECKDLSPYDAPHCALRRLAGCFGNMASIGPRPGRYHQARGSTAPSRGVLPAFEQYAMHGAMLRPSRRGERNGPTFAPTLETIHQPDSSMREPTRTPHPHNPFGIYVHVPFCKHRCLYCDFYSLVPGAYPQEYTRCLLEEYQLAKKLVEGNLRSIYLGGGTPSILRPADVATIVRALLQGARRDAPIEITMECNPDDITPTYLADIRHAGINRLSIGIQSLDPDILHLLERRHDGQQAIRAVEWAKETGFESISVDVIYGIPTLKDCSLSETIESLLAQGVQHLSAYHLTREPGTRYDYQCRQQRLSEVDETASERQYALVRNLLTDAGYEHYEISNYALPGYRAVHNASYWAGTPYLGLGPAAHSYDGQIRWHNPRNYRAYRQSLLTRRLPRMVEMRDTPEQAVTEWLLMRLRTAEGIDLQEGERLFGANSLHRIITHAKPWVERGVLQETATHLRMAPQHFLLTDSVIVDLMP